MKYIDNFLNKITMYKLVLYGLFILAGISILFGFFGILSYSGLNLIYSFLTLTVVCYTTNYLFAKAFKVQENVESASITALILFLLTFPVETFTDWKWTILVGFLAMASKYILVIKKKHIFNPTAVAVFIVGLLGSGIGAWWVGSSVMLLPVVVLGFLVLRKVQRFTMFSYFVITAVVSSVVVGLNNGGDVTAMFKEIILSGPLLFFGSIMLTEPLTTPPKLSLQIAYGSIVGILFGLQFQFGPIYSTPGLALIIGNIFSYIVSPRARLVLTLLHKNKLTPDVYDFVWKSDQKLDFKAGQYLEWTLGHAKPDARGNRRYFTVASSPTEPEIRLGTKFYPGSSSFKTKLLSLNPGDKIIASQLSGEFNLPKDKNKKLVFIAGGIGVTPFRSMVKYLLDANDKRDVVMFFSNKTTKDIFYRDIFDKAERQIGLKTLYVVNTKDTDLDLPGIVVGTINADMIMKEVPDYKERMYYISGTHGMVTAFEEALQKIGVKKSNIKIDFFPGFV